MNRLGEAKGAVELMLAQAYSKRDHVALIGFRDGRADILLPPTRSLVQAKKNLAALAAGGGTPLAMGMNSALNLAALVRRSGKLPSMAFLTDGKGNIDLEGQPGRQKAMSDAAHIAEMGRTLIFLQSLLTVDVAGTPNWRISRIKWVVSICACHARMHRQFRLWRNRIWNNHGRPHSKLVVK
jgi:magnesium chelatase subunit D